MTLPLFITGNQHKADYLAQLLAMPIEHRKLELEELQSTSLEEVVEHKTRQAYELVGKPVLVEDVALGFAALGGLPGPFIKFFTELDGGLEKLCRMLDEFDDRRAVAACVYGYYDGQEMRLFRGELTGAVAQSPRGDGGFGWDKIFCPDGYSGRTRAELSPEENTATYLRLKPIEEVGAFLALIKGKSGDAISTIRNR
ncbi:MAG: non-canonical purine NTP pyrophosphatase [Candidatus Saccharibacteria bacterium]|nr:non-canonical purine NTP pyrophosphatase [Candidatus Saccharibacteria bacterium]